MSPAPPTDRQPAPARGAVGLSDRLRGFFARGARRVWSGGRRALGDAPIYRTAMAVLIAGCTVEAAGLARHYLNRWTLPRNEAVADLIETAPPAVLAGLDHGTAASMLTQIEGHRDREALWRKLYDATPIDRDYLDALRARSVAMENWLLTAPECAQACAHYEGWSWERRRAFLQTVADRHGAIFGYDPAEIVLFESPPREVPVADGTTRTRWTDGEFRSWSRQIAINRHEVSDNDGFAGAMSTHLHELTHAFQYHLAEGLRAGEIDPDSPLHDQARLFDYNARNYLPWDENWDHYYDQPLERDAARAADLIAQTLERLEARREVARPAAGRPAEAEAPGDPLPRPAKPRI